eukprot:g1874.t1
MALSTKHPYGCFLMDFVEGGSLRDLKDKVKFDHRFRGNEGIKVVLSIIRQLSAALDFFRWRSIIHHDIKAENILLSFGTGRGVKVQITDFGGAVILADPPTNDFIENYPQSVLPKTLSVLINHILGIPQFPLAENEVIRVKNFDDFVERCKWLKTQDLSGIKAVTGQYLLNQPLWMASLKWNKRDFLDRAKRGFDAIQRRIRYDTRIEEAAEDESRRQSEIEAKTSHNNLRQRRSHSLIEPRSAHRARSK